MNPLLKIGAMLFAMFITVDSSYGFLPQRMATFSRSERLENQGNLYAKLVLGGGKIWLSKSSHGELLSVEVEYSKEETKPVFDFRDNEDGEALLFFSITSKNHYYDNYDVFEEMDFFDEDHDISLGLSSIKKTSWDLKFTDEIPIEFEIAVGAAKANLDFTGMKISNLNIEAGASRMFINFDEPNPIIMDELNLELGLAKFKGKNLLNANFDELNIEAGVGSTTLDLTGEINRRVYVNMDLGLGSTTIILPSNAGVKLYMEASFFTSVDIDELIEVKDDVYESENWGETEAELILEIDAALGLVKFIFEN